jgi:hypothetical protein
MLKAGGSSMIQIKTVQKIRLEKSQQETSRVLANKKLPLYFLALVLILRCAKISHV